MWLMFNKMAEICFAILDNRLFFCVTVIFLKWSQIFLRYLEHFRDIEKKNREFSETYLGEFS